MNVDNKIPSRSISARLLIATDQSSCVPGRVIGENVAFILRLVPLLR